jgi:hypothetical protein
MSDIFVSWIGRGSPELYASRCNIWRSPPSGKSLFTSDYYSKMTSDELTKSFWRCEVKKSQEIGKVLPLYKKYLETLSLTSN